MNCTIYARYSSHSQREESIEDQVRVCQAEAKRRGDHVIRIYADKARSGREATKRTEFLRMVEDAKSGKWGRLYIYKRDRFARNRYDAATYRRKLKDAGVEIITAAEPTSEGPESILMDSLLEGLAEYYSANLSQNIRRGLEGNALKCGHNGCSMYGYDLGDDGLYHVNQEQAAYVLMAYEMYDNGKNTREIAEAMAGQKTRAGNPWTKDSVAKMLKNEKYAGVYIFGEHRVEGGMPAIVPRDLFDRVNARFCRHNRESGYYPLSGKLYDGKGHRFDGMSARGKSGKTYYYYRIPRTRECYPKHKIEDAVSQAIGQFLASSPRLRDAIIDGILAVQDEVYGEARQIEDALRKRLGEIDREADNVVSLVAKMGATDRLADQLQALEAEKLEVQDQLRGAEEAAPHLTREVLEELMDAIVDGGAPMQIVQAFVSRITIDGGRMTITVNVDQNQIQTLAPKTELEGLYKMSLVELTTLCTNTASPSLSSPVVSNSQVIRVVVTPWGFAFSVKFTV